MESILHQATNFGTAIHDKWQRYLPGLRPLFDFACTLEAKSLLIALRVYASMMSNAPPALGKVSHAATGKLIPTVRS